MNMMSKGKKGGGKPCKGGSCAPPAKPPMKAPKKGGKGSRGC